MRSTWAYQGASGFIPLDEAGRRQPPIAPYPWGDVIVKPGEKIRLAALDPNVDPYEGILPLNAANVLLSAIHQVARIAPDNSLVIGRKALAEAVRAADKRRGAINSLRICKY